jgi:16S rRNA (uracil1498-N3)-methyltransferase
MRERAKLKVCAPICAARPESSLDLTLALALLKGEKFDLVVQKASELGVMRILPVATMRADVRVRNEQDALRRITRWQRISIEAAKQSGRARVPEVSAPIKFEDLIEGSANENAIEKKWRVMFVERGGYGLIKSFSELRARPSAVTALIGAEGGWADEEIARARQSGWSIVTLGGRTLRAETAAIVATTLLQHLLGDLV